MDFTYELSKNFNVLPFEIFKQDKDEVIMLINYLCEKGDTEPTKKRNDNRIRVDDSTATGGWY